MFFCKLLLKICFLAFFVLNGWNTFQQLDQQVATFKTDYKNLEHTLTTRTGFALPPQLKHAHVWRYSEMIVKLLAWAQIIMSAGALLVWGGFTSIVSTLFFVQQAVHLNFANLSAQSSFADFEKLALQVSLLFAGFAICIRTSSACYASTCTKGKLSDIRSSQASEKKRN